MKSSLDWLKSRWGLPADASETVAELMLAEAAGATALPLGRIPDFGGAALDAGAPGLSPLVLVRPGNEAFLQSRAMFLAEKEIAARLVALAAREIPPPARLDQMLAELFPGAGAGDARVASARVAACRALLILTGGPGTGKTFTLARILALLTATGTPAESIRLAAPTGKAAQRMGRAIVDSVESMPARYAPFFEEFRKAAASCSTLHSLLGYHPGEGVCRPSPLPENLTLIIDECSMIDIALWRVLLEVFPAGGRLLLVGDPDQLESVGRGAVFAALTRAADAGALGGVCVRLTEARRFKDRPAIQQLAGALRRRDMDALKTVLNRSKTDPGKAAQSDMGVVWIPCGNSAASFHSFSESIQESLRAIATASSPAEALAALGKVCILTAHRRFATGSEALSREIQQTLQFSTAARNTPVLITRNDARTGLRNGSTGVIHDDSKSGRKAYFDEGDGKIREFALEQLPEFTLAWALTVHRAQGSEYDEVVVVFPPGESPLTTRELLYTAITRARKRVVILARESSVFEAAQTSSNRPGGLEWQIFQAWPPAGGPA